MITVLTNNRVVPCDAARVEGGRLRLSSAQFDGIAGPLSSAEKSQVDEQFSHDGEVDVSAYWQSKNRAIQSSEAGDVWALGASAKERSDALVSLQAPDFTLADLDGKTHSLSDYRGQKIFLASWASW